MRLSVNGIHPLVPFEKQVNRRYHIRKKMAQQEPLATLQTWDDFLVQTTFRRMLRNAFFVGILEMLWSEGVGFWLWWSAFTMVDILIESLRRFNLFRKGTLKQATPDEVKTWDANQLIAQVRGWVSRGSLTEAIRLVMAARGVSKERARDYIFEIVRD